jgi:uncharacterized protein YutE (UPF0331/DUF86 family)
LVDNTLIMRKLSELEEYLAQIRTYAGITVSEYTVDWKVQRIVERTLQLMIELCLDISSHIISDRRLRVPGGYADTFRTLGEAGLISADLLVVLEKMAKFRNIVVHQYDRVDAGIVVTILQKHLDDFLLFRDAVLDILRSESE